MYGRRGMRAHYSEMHHATLVLPCLADMFPISYKGVWQRQWGGSGFMSLFVVWTN